MTMDPGQSKLELYDECTDLTCRHPIGKAHVHNASLNERRELQVFVRRKHRAPQEEARVIIEELLEELLAAPESEQIERKLHRLADLVADYMKP